MFEAKIGQAQIFKKIVDAIKDLLNDASFECGESAFALQAMDSSHVALVSLKLEAEGFEEYRCDRHLSLGLGMQTLAKILKCAGNDDTMSMRAQDDSDTLTFCFESANQERQCEYEIKLMDLDTEHLGIPDQDYACVVKMSSSEFARICRDMSQLGDSLVITCTKQGVQFQVKGDVGTGIVRLAQSANADSDDSTEIDLREPTNVTFAMKYLNLFCKAAPLAKRVSLSIANDVPIVIEFPIEEMGYIRYYLAPKIEEDDSANR